MINRKRKKSFVYFACSTGEQLERTPTQKQNCNFRFKTCICRYFLRNLFDPMYNIIKIQPSHVAQSIRGNFTPKKWKK